MMKSIILFIGMMVASSALCSGELKLTASAKVTGNKVQFKIVNHSKNIIYLCDPKKCGFQIKMKRKGFRGVFEVDRNMGIRRHWKYLIVLGQSQEAPESYGYVMFDSEIKQMKNMESSMVITLYVADDEAFRTDSIAAFRRIELPVKLEFMK